MKRNLMVLFLLAMLFMVFMVDQAEAWPGWWGPPHRFSVVRVSYYHWYPQYRPCYRYRPAYVYYPCCDECWGGYCYDGCWYYGEPYAYYCYSPCWYVHFWVGWGYYTSYCYYYRPYPYYYTYWYHRYPPPYYYDYYYAGYDYGYHHPWHDYYGDGHGRWRDGYAYRDKPYRAGNVPGKEPHYVYRDKPKNKPPRDYGKDKELAKAPIPKNKKNPYELAKVNPGKSIRSSKSLDEFERKKNPAKEGSGNKTYERRPAIREKDPSKFIDDRKKVSDRKEDGVRGKESDNDDKDDIGARTPAPEDRKKDDGSTEKYSKYRKDSERDKNVKKKDEASRKKETYSKSKSSAKDKSKTKSNSKNNSSSSRFSSPRRDNNSSSNVRRPSSSKRGGKR